MECGNLILSRKVGTEVVIGDSIIVRVHSIRGNVVRLCFEAPKSVVIRRSEVAKREAA